MGSLQHHYDVIVVGAGLQGLCAAHTFLSIDSSLSLLIIDNKASVGGTWAKQHIYPGLRANNLQGYFEFTDFPILDAGVGVRERGLLPGEAIHAYLQKFAERFDLLSRTRLNTNVVCATNNAGDSSRAWTLELASVGRSSTDSPSLTTTTCSKLLVATGQTSRPFVPSFPGSSTFQKPLIHTANLASEGAALVNNPSVSSVTVIGGGKSAHDAVYNLATAGKKVTWVIRKSGRGGKAWMAKSFPQMGPTKLWLEGLLMTRPLSWMGAAPWSQGDGFGAVRSFLHNTELGRFIVRSFYAQMSGDTVAQNGLLSLDEQGRDTLRPDETLQWYGGQAAILHYERDFYEVLGETGVEIVHEDVADLAAEGVVLNNGRIVPADAVVCATGYKIGPAFPLLPETNQLGWGVPVPPEQDDVFPPLDAKADLELFRSYPDLLRSPRAPDKFADMTPWRLWRFIAPPSQAASTSTAYDNNGHGNKRSQQQRNLAFLCTTETYENCLKAELVALWSYAYLHDELAVRPGSEPEVRYEAALWSRFGWWSRPLGKQGKTADMLFDAMPYYDRLLQDLGLSSWRKGFGILGEIFGGWYEVKDYRGIKEEWVASRRKGKQLQGEKSFLAW